MAGTEELHPQQRTHGSKTCVVTATCTPAEESVRVSFWKMVVMEDSERNEMHAITYLLSQGQLIDAGIPVIVPVEDTADLML